MSVSSTLSLPEFFRLSINFFILESRLDWGIAGYSERCVWEWVETYTLTPAHFTSPALNAKNSDRLKIPTYTNGKTNLTFFEQKIRSFDRISNELSNFILFCKYWAFNFCMYVNYSITFITTNWCVKLEIEWEMTFECPKLEQICWQKKMIWFMFGQIFFFIILMKYFLLIQMLYVRFELKSDYFTVGWCLLEWVLFFRIARRSMR